MSRLGGTAVGAPLLQPPMQRRAHSHYVEVAFHDASSKKTRPEPNLAK